MTSTPVRFSTGEIAQWKRDSLDYYWQHTAPYSAVADAGGPEIIVEASGTRVTNIEGRSFLDLYAGLELVNIGYGRPEMAEVAAEQITRLHYAGFQSTNLPGIALAKRLAEITPGDLQHVFFTTNGSDAVETAVKMARQAQIQNGTPWRSKVISRRNAYHGSTPGATSLEGPHAPITGSKHNELYAVPGARQVPELECYRCPYRLTYPDCDLLCADAIEQQIRYEDPETVAAVIVDPVAIVPRCIVPPDDYLPRVREICDRYGVLLIFDEVVNGFGRTGRWFAAMHWDVVPDILCLSKGLSSGYAPIAATVARPHVFDRFKGSAERAFHHGHTWGGHPVATAMALRNIEIIEREGLVEHAADVGAHFLEGLKSLEHYPIVGKVQGIGLLLGIDLVRDKTTREPLRRQDPVMQSLQQRVRDRGLLCPFSFITPPLIITRAEVDEAIEILDRSIGEVVEEFALA